MCNNSVKRQVCDVLRNNLHLIDSADLSFGEVRLVRVGDVNKVRIVFSQRTEIFKTLQPPCRAQWGGASRSSGCPRPSRRKKIAGASETSDCSRSVEPRVLGVFVKAE